MVDTILYYGIKQTKKVSTIENNVRNFPSRDDKTKLMYVHKVSFEDNTGGEFFQREEVFKAHEKVVTPGELLEFIPSQPRSPEQATLLRIYYEKPSSTNGMKTVGDNPNEPVKVQGTAITFSTGYAKDIMRDFCTVTGEKPTLYEYVDKIKKIAIDLKENIMKNL